MATFFRMYLFSVTNPREVEAGAQPHLEQVGPFTYSEQVERVNEVGWVLFSVVLTLAVIFWQGVPQWGQQCELWDHEDLALPPLRVPAPGHTGHLSGPPCAGHGGVREGELLDGGLQQ